MTDPTTQAQALEARRLAVEHAKACIRCAFGVTPESTALVTRSEAAMFAAIDTLAAEIEALRKDAVKHKQAAEKLKAFIVRIMEHLEAGDTEGLSRLFARLDAALAQQHTDGKGE